MNEPGHSANQSVTTGQMGDSPMQVPRRATLTVGSRWWVPGPGGWGYWELGFSGDGGSDLQDERVLRRW